MGNFCATHAAYVFTMEEVSIEEVNAQMVFEAFTSAQASVGGMDGWEPVELKISSLHLCEWVAVLYSLIEDGCSWPTSTKHARIAFLEKDGSELGEVMSYRPLTIMSPLRGVVRSRSRVSLSFSDVNEGPRVPGIRNTRSSICAIENRSKISRES